MTDMKNSNIIFDEKGDAEITKELTANLKAFNEKVIGPYQRYPFNIYVKSSENQIVAGVSGNTLCDLCCVTIFWVDEGHRRKGIGAKLQQALENHARKQGCKSIQLDTAQFQAKDFYLKVGYEVVATLPNGFMGYDQYIMRKVLLREETS